MVSSSYSFSAILGVLQILIVAFMLAFTTTPTDQNLTTHEYIIFRDIMVMLLLGFGFLMTFLKKYGLSAVGYTMALTVLAMELNLLVEPFVQGVFDKSIGPISIAITDLINAEFSAATLLISFGAVIGRASPVQLLVLAIFQAFYYTVNKVVFVFGLLGTEDVGGSITIHLFGAYFGLGVAAMFREPSEKTTKNAVSSQISDVMSLLGCTLLWVYWPSFVGATESADPETENLCVIHTVLALLGSTGVTFFLSQFITGRFDPVHIANSTLAGGVAVGASARLDITPGGALVLGVLAGTFSVVGYAHISPILERRFKIFDTCGVHNLHGLPSLLGGIASAIFVWMDSEAEFLVHDQQWGYQIAATVITIVYATFTGLLTGFVMVKVFHDEEAPEECNDAAWWQADYFTRCEHKETDDVDSTESQVENSVA